MKTIQFSSFLLLVVMTAGFLLTGCEPIPEPVGNGGVDVTVNLRSNGGGLNALGLSGPGQIGTSLIVAVNNGAAATDYLQDLAGADIHAVGLLDLATSTVTLTLPLEIPLQLLEYTYNDSLTLAEIWGGMPPAGPAQVSPSFTIDNATSTVTVSMPLLTDGFNEDFAATGLHPQVWESTYLSRAVDTTSVTTPLTVTLAAQDLSANNMLEPVDFTAMGVTDLNGITSMQANVMVTAVTATGASSNPHARLAGRFYHTITTGEATGSAVGDVHAEISLNGTEARYMVGICGAVACGSGNFTILNTGFVSLGTVTKGTEANLAMAWDSTAQVFTFTLSGGTPVTFDPVAAGAPVSGAANRPWKAIGNRIGLGSGSEGSIAAQFGTVTLNGTLYDDFSNPAGYIDPAKWNRTEVGLTNATGIATLETRRSYDANPNATGSATMLSSNRNRFLNNHRVGGILSVQGYTRFDVTPATTPVEVRAVAGLRYQPRANRGDSLNRSDIWVMLQDHGAGLVAGMRGFTCQEATCATTLSGNPTTLDASGTLSLIFPVEDLGTGTASTPKLPFTLEYLGNGVFEAVLDGHKRTVDMTGVTGWNENDFLQAVFRSEVRNINEATEEAAILAQVASVELGDATTDKLPPGRVNTVVPKGESTVVNLTWVNPADADFSSVHVRRTNVGITLTGPDDTAGDVMYNGTNTNVSDIGLVIGTSYDYHLFTSDAAGNISPAKVVTGTANWAGDIANPLASLAAIAGDVALSWDNPPDSTLAGVRVTRAVAGGATTQVFFDEPGVCFTDRTGDTTSTSITYTIQAVDTVGNVSFGGTAVHFPTTLALGTEPPPPDPVSGLTATVVSATVVKLDWVNPRNAPNCDLVGVRIARNTTGSITGFDAVDPGFMSSVFTAPLNAITWSDPTVVSGTTYYYAVFTEDSSGNFTPTGTEVSVTVP